MSNPRGLGKGLDALIPKQLSSQDQSDSPGQTGQISQVSPNDITPNPHQPRSQFEASALNELAESIKEHGILQPLVVIPKGSKYELVAGERRLRAAKQLKLSAVPVIIRSLQKQQQLELAVVENAQREDLNALESAMAYRKLIDEFGVKESEIAKRVGKAPTTVKNTLRLLGLAEPAKQALLNGKISEGHARALLGVTDTPSQIELLKQTLSQHLSVRQVEALTAQGKQISRSKSPLKPNPANQQLAASLGAKLGTTVSLQGKTRGGKLIIDYKDQSDLERIIKRIG